MVVVGLFPALVVDFFVGRFAAGFGLAYPYEYDPAVFVVVVVGPFPVLAVFFVGLLTEVFGLVYP